MLDLEPRSFFWIITYRPLSSTNCISPNDFRCLDVQANTMFQRRYKEQSMIYITESQRGSSRAFRQD